MDDKLKEDLCEAGRRLYANGFIAAMEGNLSIRTGENEVIGRLVKILERPSPREESSRQGESASVPRPVPKLGPLEIDHKSAA